jgi:putative oxidoreductase
MQKQTIPASIGLLILRAGIGGYMATHGWSKLQMVLDGNYAMFADPIGIGPHASLILTAFAEFVCAVLVVVGLGTRLAAIPIVIAMGVAAFVAHGADPWSMETAAIRFMTGESESWGSKQPALMFMIPFLALAFTGPGRFSLDTLVRAWWLQRQGTAKPA